MVRRKCKSCSYVNGVLNTVAERVVTVQKNHVTHLNFTVIENGFCN